MHVLTLTVNGQENTIFTLINIVSQRTQMYSNRCEDRYNVITQLFLNIEATTANYLSSDIGIYKKILNKCISHQFAIQ